MRGKAMKRSAGEKPTYLQSAGLDPVIAAQLSAARAGDQREFSGLTEPYRHELQLHCYRILGSLQDAEDIVQETLLRAWRRLETYEGRAPLRAWLYKIATNACFDALSKRPRRVLPTMQYAPADPRQRISAALVSGSSAGVAGIGNAGASEPRTSNASRRIICTIGCSS